MELLVVLALLLAPIALVEPWRSPLRFFVAVGVCPPAILAIFSCGVLFLCKPEGAPDGWRWLAYGIAVWSGIKLALACTRR